MTAARQPTSPPLTGSARPSRDSRPRTSPMALRCCQAPSGGRCRRSTRSPGASTTSATERCPFRRRSRRLTAARGSLADLAAGNAADAAATGDLVLVALRDAADRFPLPLAAFGELIDGCEADVRGVSYATFDELEHYCRCVAGSIGRLSLGVFGSTDPEAAAHAGRRARRRASADEHPARHPRGPRERQGVPAR